MKTLTFLFTAFMSGIYAFAQACIPEILNQQLFLPAEQFSVVPESQSLRFLPNNTFPYGLYEYKEKFNFLADDDPQMLLDSIVVERFNENNLWIKEGIYKYGVEKAGNTITFIIYFLDENTYTWTGFPRMIHEYNEVDSIMREVVYSFNFNVKDKTVSYYLMEEFLYSYNEGKTEQKSTFL